MSDFDDVMERIVVEPEFARALSRDPARALRGYALSAAEQRLLATQVSPDPAGGTSGRAGSSC
jgi:hypothetical protein